MPGDDETTDDSVFADTGSDSGLLQQQLKAERAQRKFDAARYEEQIATLQGEARLELARRDTRDAFASAPTLSAIRD
jgi:hypothetical protein